MKKNLLLAIALLISPVCFSATDLGSSLKNQLLSPTNLNNPKEISPVMIYGGQDLSKQAAIN